MVLSVKNNYIALGGLFAGLHVLFLLMSKFVVGSELILVLFLPLLSTIYTLKCDKKGVAMFLVATFLICLVFDFVSTFIYVVPSLICGVTYGVLRKNKFKELELLCLSGLIHMISISISFLVIIFLFKELDFVSFFESFFSLSGERLLIVTLLTLLVLGFGEAFIVHVIADNELEKIANRVEKNEVVPKWFAAVAGVSFCFTIVTYFLFRIYCVFPMIVFFIFFIPYIVNGIINLRYKILTFSLIVLFFFVCLFILNYIDPIVYLVIPIFIVSPFVINNFKDNKGKNF